ncbi:MAG: hypothetical protein ACLSHG_04400 [Oscillospiraceae bacterium]
MLEILTRNYNYRNKAVRLYEIGKVYFARPDGMADEPKLLCPAATAAAWTSSSSGWRRSSAIPWPVCASPGRDV